MIKCDKCVHEEYCELCQRYSNDYDECNSYRQDLCDVDFDNED